MADSSVSIALRARLTARLLALRRRAARLTGGSYDPYPPPPDGVALSPSAALAADIRAARLTLGWARAGAGGVSAWQRTARSKLAELIGYDLERAPPRLRQAEELCHPAGLRRRRIYLAAGPGRDVPVNLFWPPGAESGPLPAMLCLTGTNVGAHCAWGEALNPADPIKIARGLDFAVQAARRGFLAVVIEQLGFGERRERGFHPTAPIPGTDAAHHALLVGRTLLGLWVSDLSSVVDWLLAEAGLADAARLYAMGHSAGGTTALFGAALDTRIAGVIASGCVGSWRRNMARRRDQEGQLAIPGILDWLEMADVLGLVAPRPLVVVAGSNDHIWTLY